MSGLQADWLDADRTPARAESSCALRGMSVRGLGGVRVLRIGERGVAVLDGGDLVLVLQEVGGVLEDLRYGARFRRRPAICRTPARRAAEPTVVFSCSDILGRRAALQSWRSAWRSRSSAPRRPWLLR